ncbi:MAG TPA: glycosyl hydrolase 108 family protein [Crinalium sp.]|jgi:peptidoglycan hydrolase-like protein with peptidoglycan-binding domain
MDLQTIAQGQNTYPISAIRSDRTLIQSLQISLNKMGFAAGKVDGVWNESTDTAYRSFIDYYGFNPGELSPRVARFIITTAGIPVPPISPTPAPTPTPTPRPTPTPTPTPTPAPSGNAVFQEGLRFTLQWEGGWVNNPADPGGETNKGITAATYSSYRQRKGLPNQSVRFITDAEVREIYFDMYWRPSNCDLKVRPLAIVHFDTAVNFGVGGSTLFLQEVLGITADGVYGPGTKAALAKANSAITAKRYCQARIDYRYKRVSQTPSQRVFLAGWLNRDNDLLRYISNMT